MCNSNIFCKFAKEIKTILNQYSQNPKSRKGKENKMKTIRLYILGKHLYPTDTESAMILKEQFALDRIPGEKLWLWSPRIVKAGYKMAIYGDINDIEL